MTDKIHYELSVFNAIIFAILLIGCVYQVLDISHLFFSRQTNISVKLHKDSVVDLPAITICTNVSHTVNARYLEEVFGKDNVNEKTPKWIQTEFLQKLPVKEQVCGHAN